MKTPFLGGTYVSRSRNLVYSRAVNLYPQRVETGQGKEVGAFFGTPGLDLLATLGNGPIRGGRVVGNFAYVVSGDGLYKVDNAFTGVTLLGTLGTSGGPVSIIDNNFQLLVSDGVAGYLVVIATDNFSVVATFPAGAATLAYQDGFGLANIAGTNQFNQSDNADLSVWNALNFSNADAQPGSIVSLVDTRRELWVLCESNAEIWVNAGLAGFSFQRLTGVYIEVGCVAPYSAVHNADQSTMWLSKNENGDGVCMRAEGYSPKRVSTHGVEREWKKYDTIADAVAFTYQQEGDYFYVLSFPTGDATWVYDLGTGLWHERASFINGDFHRHWSNCHFFFAGKNVVGDYSNGKLYAFNLSTYTDAGTPRKWLRTWRAFPEKQQTLEPTRFNKLQIDCQTGIEVPAGVNPLFALRYADDGGHKWSSEIFESAGKAGQTATSVQFTRLGATHRNGGLDRVFELSSDFSIPAALTGAELDAERN